MNINNEVIKLYQSKKYFIKLKRKKQKKKIIGIKLFWILTEKKRNRFSKIEKIKFYKNNRNLIKKINLLKAKKILDLGCGNGFLLSMLSNKFKKTGVENDLLAIQNAEKYAEIIKLDLNKSFTLKEKYDVVILHHVIEHLINPIKLLKKFINFILIKMVT